MYELMNDVEDVEMDQPFLLSEKTFCSVNYFPAKIFSGILEKGNLSEQKKFWREKIH
jgi:hypothetical protein